MKQPLSWRMLLTAVLLGIFAFSAHAATVMNMDLNDLVGNADKVFRGTVTGKEPGTVSAGGGELPITIYTFKVHDSLKGDVNGGGETLELRMYGSLKAENQTGSVQRFNGMNMNPDLTVGREYVLFTTTPSSVGLSTTVGLDQGLFQVFSDASGREQIANGLNNQGLFDGPVSYDEISAAVRRLVNK